MECVWNIGGEANLFYSHMLQGSWVNSYILQELTSCCSTQDSGIFKRTTSTRYSVYVLWSVKSESICKCWLDMFQDRRSTTGYYTPITGNLVSWKSKKLLVVALIKFRGQISICIAFGSFFFSFFFFFFLNNIAHRSCEQLWLRILLQELGFK